MVQHAAALAREGGDPALTEAVASAEMDALPDRLRALCTYALKLTLTPWKVVEPDLDPLRDAGLSDREIVDANQVIAYFNYVNRIADGLGVDLEEEWPPEAREPREYGLRRTLE